MTNNTKILQILTSALDHITQKASYYTTIDQEYETCSSFVSLCNRFNINPFAFQTLYRELIEPANLKTAFDVKYLKAVSCIIPCNENHGIMENKDVFSIAASSPDHLTIFLIIMSFFIHHI